MTHTLKQVYAAIGIVEDHAGEYGNLHDAIDCLEGYADLLSERTAAARKSRCKYCDDTGDVHSIDGEWRGTCNCQAAHPAASVPSPFIELLRLSRGVPYFADRQGEGVTTDTELDDAVEACVEWLAAAPNQTVASVSVAWLIEGSYSDGSTFRTVVLDVKDCPPHETEVSRLVTPLCAAPTTPTEGGENG